MKHPCWGVCLEGECKQKCAHQMGAPHMWCKENCGECMKCVKKSHQEQMEKEGQQGPMAGGQGTQGPMTGGQGSQGPMGGQGQGTQGPMTGGQGPMGGQGQGPQGGEVGSNTCDCGDGTMTCACTGLPMPAPQGDAGAEES